jgi:hypothetical protein
MSLPARLTRQAGRHALVDGIPFAMPVDSQRTSALMAAFAVDAERATRLLPAGELQPLRLPGGRGVLIITVVDYRTTDIGRYLEFSIALACTRGARRTPPLLPALLRRPFGTGQFVLDLPVNTEISVKGGKGIWGMPKHRTYLEFEAGARSVTSRYWIGDRPAVTIEVRRPRFLGLPLAGTAATYSAFRGMLFRATLHVRGRGGVGFPFTRSARLTLGDQREVAHLADLGIAERPLFAAWFPQAHGVLDDHCETWFLTFPDPPREIPEGMESVVGLGLGREWPPRPMTETAASRPSGAVEA